MKTTQKTWTVLLLALAASAAAAFAADPSAPTEPTLKVGDRAPKLQVGRWAQGEPVKEFEPGKTYIVEFWTIRSAPSRAFIPHLNEISTKFKDKGLVVIGVDSFEQDEAQVDPFIRKAGNQMTYRIAIDDKAGGKSGKMAETWLAAAGLRRLPSAFLIDTKGVVAWIGSAMELKEPVIQQVMNGTFDLQKAAANYEKQVKEVTALEKDLGPAAAKLNDVARDKKEKKWDEAANDLAAAEKLIPENRKSAMATAIGMNRFDILMGKKDYASACQVAGQLAEANKDNPKLQNYLAWEIATDKGNSQHDLDLAEKLANRAVEISKAKDAEFLDTQALVQFLKGKKEQAIQTQSRAVELAGPALKQSLQGRLDSYKKGEIPNTN